MSLEYIQSIEDVLQNYPERVDSLFQSLDLTRGGFSQINKNWKEGEKIRACENLLEYYSTNYDESWIDFETQWEGWDHNRELDDIHQDIFTFQNVRDKIPRKKNGHLNWRYLGPNHDREFGFFLNRQHYLRILVDEYLKDHEEKYAEQFDHLLQDWLITNPVPWRKKHNVVWRTLEASLRIMWVWTFTFFGFLKASQFTPATRLLMLSSIPKHAEYIKKYYVNSGNIRVMELNSLTTIGAVWPQFKNATQWVQHGIEKLKPELLSEQVYPDGVQKELTSHYHMVAMKNFEHAMNMAEKKGVKIPKEYKNKVEKMWNYYAYTTRPNGLGLLNNDADLDDHREDILKAADRFGKDDWKYIVSNGEKGKIPELSSFISPWAGHLISRESYKQNAQWGFFDFGPLGTGHIHKDKLHVSISAYGKDIVVDSGRYRYINDKWRKKYFKATRAHNTILIDHAGQTKFKDQNERPIPHNQYEINEKFDFGLGFFDKGYKRGIISRLFNKAYHIRAYSYVRGNFWIILDKVFFRNFSIFKNKATIQALWHFHPDYHPIIDDGIVQLNTQDNKNLTIVPIVLDAHQWQVKKIRGQEYPSIQGWWSKEYNLKVPATCIEFDTKASRSNIFGWLLIPFESSVPEVNINDFSVLDNSTNIRAVFKVNGQKFEMEFKMDYQKLKEKNQDGKYFSFQQK